MYVALFRGEVQCCRQAAPTLSVDVGTGNDEGFAAPRMAVCGGIMQRREALGRNRADVGVCVQHHLHTLQLALFGAVMQRDLARAVLVVDICALQHEKDNKVGEATECRLFQRRIIVFVHRIHVRALCHQEARDVQVVGRRCRARRLACTLQSDQHSLAY